ncbi:MAG: sigma-70 family RNA polymerase sigma factor [Gemmatimonadetes bacterium]|nr:sigma-70 family RNA polymerase sigma factor [Gemmatimonadota bacterium]
MPKQSFAKPDLLSRPALTITDRLDHIDRQNRAALLQEALRLTHGEMSEAEDLVQETFLKALRHDRNGGQIREQNRRWLLTILTNTYIDRYRRRSVRPVELSYDGLDEWVTSDEEAEAAPAVTVTGPVLPWPEQRERFRWVFTDEVLCALNRLPDVFRSAVLLTDVEGLSYKEAADRLSVPLGTVMSRIHRGRARMRRSLSDPLSPCLN